MEVVNPFILKNKERMIVFLDQLSSVTDPNPPLGSYIESNSSHLCSDAGLFAHFRFNKIAIAYLTRTMIITFFQDVNWQHYITFVYRICRNYKYWAKQIRQLRNWLLSAIC